MRPTTFLKSLSRRWYAVQALRPWLPIALVLLALNTGYFAWSQGAGASPGEALLPEFHAASIVLLTPEEGQRRQAQALAQARTKAAPPPDMLVEFEAAPAKEIPPDR